MEQLEMLLAVCKNVKMVNGQPVMPSDHHGIDVARILRDSVGDLENAMELYGENT